MTVFLAISGTLYQNYSLMKIAPALPNASPAEIANLIAGTSSQTYKNLSAEAKALVIPQITDAMRNIWLFFLVGAALSFVLSGFLGVSGGARRAYRITSVSADLTACRGRGSPLPVLWGRLERAGKQCRWHRRSCVGPTPSAFLFLVRF